MTDPITEIPDVPEPAEPPVKVLICILNMGQLATDLASTLFIWNKRDDVDIVMPYGLYPISYARNYCGKKFLEGAYTHLFFIDEDTCPPSDALDKLLEADRDVITGIVNAYRGGIKEVAQLKYKGKLAVRHPGSGVKPIDVTGAACLMIKRWVLEKVEFPWFEEKPWGNLRGEDIIFMDKLAAANIPRYAHYEVRCPHLKRIPI